MGGKTLSPKLKKTIANRKKKVSEQIKKDKAARKERNKNKI